MSDAYGTDLTLGPAGDFIVTPSGDLATLDGALNAGQAMLSQLRTTTGELPLHPDYGSQVNDAIGRKDLDESLTATTVTNELRRLIAGDRRFISAEATVARADPDGGREVIRVAVSLAGGEQFSIADLSDVRLDELAVSDPPTLDALTAELDPALVGIEVVLDPDDELPELEDLIDTPDALDTP